MARYSGSDEGFRRLRFMVKQIDTEGRRSCTVPAPLDDEYGMQQSDLINCCGTNDAEKGVCTSCCFALQQLYQCCLCQQLHLLLYPDVPIQTLLSWHHTQPDCKHIKLCKGVLRPVAASTNSPCSLEWGSAQLFGSRHRGGTALCWVDHWRQYRTRNRLTHSPVGPQVP